MSKFKKQLQKEAHAARERIRYWNKKGGDKAAGKISEANQVLVKIQVKSLKYEEKKIKEQVRYYAKKTEGIDLFKPKGKEAKKAVNKIQNKRIKLNKKINELKERQIELLSTGQPKKRKRKEAIPEGEYFMPWEFSDFGEKYFKPNSSIIQSINGFSLKKQLSHAKQSAQDVFDQAESRDVIAANLDAVSGNVQVSLVVGMSKKLRPDAYKKKNRK